MYGVPGVCQIYIFTILREFNYVLQTGRLAIVPTRLSPETPLLMSPEVFRVLD